MTGDTVNQDLVVEGNERLGRLAVGASCPGGEARLPPRRKGLDDLPCPFAIVIASRVISRSMAAVRRPRGHGFGDRERAVWGPEARVIAPWGNRQLLVTPKNDDAHPLVVGRDLVHLNANQWVGPHPLDLLPRGREAIEAPGSFMVGKVDRDDVGLILMHASQLGQPRSASTRRHSSLLISRITIVHLHRRALAQASPLPGESAPAHRLLPTNGALTRGAAELSSVMAWLLLIARCSASESGRRLKLVCPNFRRSTIASRGRDTEAIKQAACHRA